MVGRLFFLFTAFFCMAFSLEGVEKAYVKIEGYLEKENLNRAEKLLDEQVNSETKQVFIHVKSTSGDIQQTLDFTKILLQKKEKNKFSIVVYIEDEALGPAAVLPFIADEIITSLFVNWGDILLGSETVLPVNILKSRVRSLISEANSQKDFLLLLSQAMIDATLQVISVEGEWQIADKPPTGKAVTVISHSGERLVLDQQQLREKGLSKGSFSYGSFLNYVGLPQQIHAETTGSLREGKGFAEEFEKYIRFSPDGDNAIGRIYIGGRETGIAENTWIYVKSALDYYKENKPVFILLELDTPGGEVFASQKISDALREMDTKYGVPVVAYINSWAISAGAMLAYSCRFIVTAPGASMGAAAPVLGGGGGKPIEAPEKYKSALRTDFANRAEFYNRDPNLAQAMVDDDIIIVRRYGKILRLEGEDQIILTGPSPDEVITRKDKLLTLNAEQMLKYGISSVWLEAETLEPVSEIERRGDKWSFKKVLLSKNEHFSQIPEAYIDNFSMDWRTSFFAFLARPAIASLLFLGMMLGFYTELNTPGFGLPGSVGIACLSLIILSSFAQDAVNVLELIMIAAGATLLLIEIFVLPGFGVAGILGSLLLIGGIFAILLPDISHVDFDFDEKTLNAAGEVFFERLMWLCASLIVFVFSAILLGRYVLPNVTFFNRLVLAGEQEVSKGFVAGVQKDRFPPVGSKGIAKTALRPSGKVLVGQELFDGTSSGGFIEKDDRVVVVDISGSHLVVDKEEH